jgi:hypothetical protein
MKRALIDESLWFIHKDGGRFYPWQRYSKHHGISSFWVSDGSNLIEDAVPVATIAELVVEVFSHGRSVWLFDNGRRGGLYRYGHDAILGWGASAEVASMALRAGAPAEARAGIHKPLPALVAKALADTGYDLLSPADDGWFAAAISGSAGRVLVHAADEGVLLAVAEPTMAQKIGLASADVAVPADMADIGVAHGPMQLYEALRVLHSLQTHPASTLSARVEARLADIPETERTREVRQRIGQDVFREALMDLWQGRCAVTGIPFPPELLRASHAKPWAKATDAERLDPFNGLLLAIHLDAMFDTGLIGFDEQGCLIASPQLDPVVKLHFDIRDGSQLRNMAPGHMPYLAWHRKFVLRR